MLCKTQNIYSLTLSEKVYLPLNYFQFITLKGPFQMKSKAIHASTHIPPTTLCATQNKAWEASQSLQSYMIWICLHIFFMSIALPTLFHPKDPLLLFINPGMFVTRNFCICDYFCPKKSFPLDTLPGFLSSLLQSFAQISVP